MEQEDVGGTAPWLLKVILKCKTGSQSMHILPPLYYHPTNLVVRTYVDTHTQIIHRVRSFYRYGMFIFVIFVIQNRIR